MRALVYYFAPFLLDVRERRLVCEGRPIPLRAKVFDTLCLLLERAGHLVSREELMRAIWPDATVHENNLEHNLSVLRKVFRQNYPDAKYIETVSRRGYRFVAEVREAEQRPATFRVLAKDETERSPSSRLRLRQSSRGARRSGELRGQAVRPFVVEDDELRRLARELQISAGPLLASMVYKLDRMASEQDVEVISGLLSETSTLSCELAHQFRAHLLPALYLSRQHAVGDFFADLGYDDESGEGLSSETPSAEPGPRLLGKARTV